MRPLAIPAAATTALIGFVPLSHAGAAAPTPAGSWVRGEIRSVLVPKPRSVLVYLPPSYRADAERSYATIYFLHGGPGLNHDWLRKGRLGPLLDRLEREGSIPECIAVLPDATGPGRLARSLYVNSFDGRSRMEDFLTGDLVAWVDRYFRTRRDPAGRYLVGVSDGGGAALNLAFRHPGEFAGCAGLSGEYRLREGHGLEPVLGVGEVSTQIQLANSPLVYVADRARWFHGLRIYFDCGWLDPAIFDNLSLDRRLEDLGVAHAFHAYCGSHGWSWWRSRASVALPYLLRAPSASTFHPRPNGALPAGARVAPGPGLRTR